MDLIESTLRMMVEGEECIVLSETWDIIAILGPTGAGKTTLGLLLTNNNTELVSQEVGLGDCLTEEEACEPETAIPDMMIDNATGTVFYDMPSFGGPHNSSTEIATMYLMKKVLAHADRVKLVFVVNHDTVVSAQSRSEFSKLLEYATVLIKDVDKFKNSIGMVLTRGDLDGLPRPSSMNKTIEHARETLRSAMNRTGSERNFIGVLSTPTKLSIFSNIDQGGPLSNNTRVQKEKERIKRMIKKNLVYTASNEDDFGSPISDTAKHDLSRIFQNITDTLIAAVKRSTETIEQQLLYEETRKPNLMILGKKYQTISDRLSKIIVDTHVSKLSELVRSVGKLTGSSQDFSKIGQLVGNLERIGFVPVESDLKKTSESILEYMRSTRDRLRRTQHWFEFLKNLEWKASGERLKPTSDAYQKFQTTISSIENTKLNITIGNSTGLRNLMKELFLDDETTSSLAGIDSVEMNPARARLLKQVVDFTFVSKPVATCYGSTKQRISAPYMELKEAMALARDNCPSVRVLEIFAGKKLWINEDIEKSGENFTLVIAAPVWQVVGRKKIILDGQDGAAHARVIAGDGDSMGGDGMAGSPGLSGQNGGHFVGIADKIVNLDKLTITVNGGRGGPGQHGGKGRDGADGLGASAEVAKKAIGRDASIVNTKTGDPRWTKGCCEPWLGSQDSGWIRGEDGGHGGLGGRGGAGGLGGRAGTIRITVPNIPDNQLSVNDGEVGIKGNRGIGGFDGKAGQDCRVEFDRQWFVVPRLTTWCYKNVCPDKQPRERDDSELNREQQQYPLAQSVPDFDSLSGDYKSYIEGLREEWSGLWIPSNFTDLSNHRESRIYGDVRGKTTIDFGYFSYSIYLLNMILRKCTKVKEVKFQGKPGGDEIRLEPVILTGKFGDLLERLKENGKVTRDCGNFDPISMITELKTLMNQKRYVGIRQMLKNRLTSLGMTPPEETEQIINQLLDQS